MFTCLAYFYPIYHDFYVLDTSETHLAVTLCRSCGVFCVDVVGIWGSVLSVCKERAEWNQQPRPQAFPSPFFSKWRHSNREGRAWGRGCTS